MARSGVPALAEDAVEEAPAGGGGLGEELARMADQLAIWLTVDAVPWFVNLTSSLWEFFVANSLALSHLALVLGVYLLWRRARAADRQAAAANEQARVANVQAKTAEQGHITDRFTKAVEQLGSEKMAVRLGGIYALERLSRDSPEDHWTIMEVLTAYVRDNAQWPRKEPTGNPFVELQLGGKKNATAWVRPASDIQTALTVLGRRRKEAREADVVANRRLDLSGTDLRGIDLRGANLQWALFIGAHLTRGTLAEADLKGADLAVADLSQARRTGACEPPGCQVLAREQRRRFRRSGSNWREPRGSGPAASKWPYARTTELCLRRR